MRILVGLLSHGHRLKKYFDGDLLLKPLFFILPYDVYGTWVVYLNNNRNFVYIYKLIYNFWE